MLNTIETPKKQQQIAKTWKSGQNSCCLIIERKLAEEYGLSEPQYVILERRSEGILIRKLREVLE